MRHRSVLGFLELSLGRPQPAVEILAPAVDYLERSGRERVPVTVGSVFADLIEALVQLGRVDDARVTIRRLERVATLSKAPATRIAILRSRALLAGALGDGRAAQRELSRCLEALDDFEYPFERARTLLVLGGVSRRMRQKRAAREALDEAHVTFERLGALLWQAKAEAEIARISGRRARNGALTPTEERIAELVAAGCTNREVAHALFMSPKTVEWNLSKIYGTVGVRSRRELARAIAAGSIPGISPGSFAAAPR